MLRRKFRPKIRNQVVTPTLNVRSTVLGRRIGFVADAVRELDLALTAAPGDPGGRQFEPIDRKGTTLDEFITWLCPRSTTLVPAGRPACWTRSITSWMSLATPPRSRPCTFACTSITRCTV